MIIACNRLSRLPSQLATSDVTVGGSGVYPMFASFSGLPGNFEFNYIIGLRTDMRESANSYLVIEPTCRFAPNRNNVRSSWALFSVISGIKEGHFHVVKPNDLSSLCLCVLFCNHVF